MLPPLNQIIGVPTATAPAHLGGAARECFSALLARGSSGAAMAHSELVGLRVACLNLACANPDAWVVPVRSRMS
jgi:hypothetical protein